MIPPARQNSLKVTTPAPLASGCRTEPGDPESLRITGSSPNVHETCQRMFRTPFRQTRSGRLRSIIWRVPVAPLVAGAPFHGNSSLARCPPSPEGEQHGTQFAIERYTVEQEMQPEAPCSQLGAIMPSCIPCASANQRLATTRA